VFYIVYHLYTYSLLQGLIQPPPPETNVWIKPWPTASSRADMKWCPSLCFAATFYETLCVDDTKHKHKTSPYIALIRHRHSWLKCINSTHARTSRCRYHLASSHVSSAAYLARGLACG